MTFYVLIFAAGVAAAPSAAQQQAPTATPQSPIVISTPRPDEQKKICTSVVETGHIMPKRICMSKADWDAIHQRSVAQLQQIRADRDAHNKMQAQVENQ